MKINTKLSSSASQAFQCSGVDAFYFEFNENGFPIIMSKKQYAEILNHYVSSKEGEKMIAKEKIELIQSSLDQANVAVIIQHLGYDIYRGYKFRLRDERSASTSIRGDGYIRDFGGDFSGDLIDLLRQHHGMSFQEAVEYLAICMGVEL